LAHRWVKEAERGSDLIQAFCADIGMPAEFHIS
jgi:hypothetical protein